MCARARNNSALTRRIKELEKELSTVNGDIKVLSKVVKQAEHAGVSTVLPVPAVHRTVEPEQQVPVRQEPRIPVSVLKQPSVEYSQPRMSMESAARKSVVAERDQMPRDGRLATYLMSRDFHNVRPLRHERHIQRNKAIFMIVIAVIILLYLVMRFLP
ncbi:MAG: hypothetical protein PHR77_12705 [Kiritimatiellae bacterium]|nr:hypothetical protein [Kiritimatiellia bacterium]MDD5522166.1 hypothetical protein [Kiritimatiellia bacterium]